MFQVRKHTRIHKKITYRIRNNNNNNNGNKHVSNMNNDYLTIFHFLFLPVCSFLFCFFVCYRDLSICLCGFLVRFIISNIYLFIYISYIYTLYILCLPILTPPSWVYLKQKTSLKTLDLKPSVYFFIFYFLAFSI